jgi:hypothetical protein
MPSHEGTLLVYSAWELFGDPDSVNQHSSYVVASDDGKLVKQVQNHIDRFDEGPQPIAVSPGSYTVTAQAAHIGKVNVPVVVKERQTTFIFLDGYTHPEAPSPLQTNVVKLPNGEIAGWSVNAMAK